MNLPKTNCIETLSFVITKCDDRYVRYIKEGPMIECIEASINGHWIEFKDMDDII